MGSYNIVNAKIDKTGENPLWKPKKDHSVTIRRLEVFGYCEASLDNPFILNIEILKDNRWKELSGIKCISSKDFNLPIDFPDMLETDVSNGSLSVLRVTIDSSNKNDFNISASIAGHEFKRRK